MAIGAGGTACRGVNGSEYDENEIWNLQCWFLEAKPAYALYYAMAAGIPAFSGSTNAVVTGV